MEFQLDNGKYQIVFCTSNLNITIEESTPLNVVIGEKTEIDVGQVITYIKSGEKEINEAVQQRIAFFNSNAQEQTDIFNTNASEVKAEINAVLPDIKESINKLNENKQDTLSSINAGTGISISGSGENVLISNTQTSAEWGNITGVLSNQTDLNSILSEKQNILTFDNTPTSNSSNPVTSKGIYEALDNIMQNISSGLEIGDIGIAPLGIDEAQNKRRYLNGQVISQSQFESFTNKIKEAIQLNPSLGTTEENWQAEVSNSVNGTCGKFVIDDVSGTIRLPKYPEYVSKEYVESAVVGNGMTLGLTNGSDLAGLIQRTASGESYGLRASLNQYGSNLSTSQPTSAMVEGTFGVTTDPTKSGIVADLKNATTETIPCKWFIQVATGVEESVDVTREIELNNPFSLLDYKWSEYELNNASWLLSNGQFNSGATYISVYNLLLEIYNGTVTKDGVSVKLSTETYEDTDFVLNTADTTFRLPIKVKLASGSAVVGNGTALGLTNGTINAGMANAPTQGIDAYSGNYGNPVGIANSGSTLQGTSASKSVGVTTDSTKSGIETSSQDLKLYFYVGETIQDANVIAASQVLSMVVNKADGDLGNVSNVASSFKEQSVGWGMPDYSAGVSAPSKNTVAQTDIYVKTDSPTNASGTIYINDVSVANGWEGFVCAYVPKGATFRVSGKNSKYYPLKGVN